MARTDKQQVKRLAVAYSAYNEAVANEEWDSVKVWGKMLIEAQKETGVELTQEETIKRVMRY